MKKILTLVVVALLSLAYAIAQTNTIQLRNGANTTTIIAPTGGNYTLTLPAGAGTNGQVLSTNGSGTLSWTTVSGVSSLDGLSDAKVQGTDFNGSMILGHRTTGSLSLARYNTAVGIGSLDAITSGDDNTAIGYNALSAAQDAFGLTAVGSGALEKAVNATRTVAIGYQAGYNITSGQYSVFVGFESGKAYTSQANSVGVGYQSLLVATGDDNVAIGSQASVGVTSGIRNVVIGSGAGANVTTGNSNIIIGYAAGPSANVSNSLYIDNSQTNSPLIYGDFSTDQLTLNGHVEVAIGTTTSTVPFSIVGTGIQGAANVENAYLGTDVPTLFVRNTTNSADANAVLLVGVGGSGGASSAGDAYLSLDVATVGGWSMGIDNSDSDKLKFLDSWDFKSDGGTPDEYGLPVMTMTRLTRRVGIGTENPAYMLDVAGDINASGALTINGTLTAGNSTLGATTATYITALKGSAAEGGEMYIEFGDGDGGWIIDEISPAAGDPTEERMRIFPYYTGGGGGETSGMSIEAGGNVGIGIVNPAYKLDVTGDINATGDMRAATHVTTSDARLKRNIQPLTNALDVVQQLRPVSYEKRASLQSDDYSMKQMGFIAQELESVLPTSVHTDKSADAIKSVDYISIIPVLTKALQEQQELIAKQQELVAKQQQEIDELKKMVKRMSIR